MGSLSVLRSHQSIEIPRPLCARSGDVFECVDFPGEVPLGFAVGFIASVWLNPQLLNGIYVLEFEETLVLARLIFSDLMMVSVQSFHEYFPSGEYRLDKLNIRGLCVEIYPTGDLGDRWILYQPGMEMKQNSLPALIKKDFYQVQSN